MHNKKSINAKDILNHPSQLKQKSYSLDFPSHVHPSPEKQSQTAIINSKNSQLNQQKNQKQKEFQENQSSQISFLAKIRASGGRNRYKRDSRDSMEVGEFGTARDAKFEDKKCNSTEINGNQRMRDNNQGNQQKASKIIKQNRAKNNYSPFCTIENSKSELNTIFNTTHVKLKVPTSKKTPIRSFYSTFHSKSPAKHPYKQKSFAKMLQFKTQFSKIKIFQQQQKHQLAQMVRNGSQCKSNKMSPYQLSIRRKNINLIKMKLNSLGEQADDQEKNRCLELSRICENNEEKKRIRLWRLKIGGRDELRAVVEKKMDKWYKKYTEQHHNNHQHSYSHRNRYSHSLKRQQHRSTHALEMFDLQSKTIQIREVPKGGHRHWRRDQQKQEKQVLSTSHSPANQNKITSKKRVKTINYLTINK